MTSKSEKDLKNHLPFPAILLELCGS